MMEERDWSPEASPDEQEPHIFVVRKDLHGWQFDRRDFLAAAGIAAAGVAVGTATGCVPGLAATATFTPEPPTSTSTTTPTFTPTATPVPSSTPTRTATPTKTATRIKTPTPTLTPTLATTNTLVVPQAQFIADVTIPDGTQMQPGQSFTKTWRLKNSGAVDWGEGSQLVFKEGSPMSATSPVTIAGAAPGKTVDISVDMVAPTAEGNYTGWWNIQAANGTVMTSIFVVIVVGGAATATPPGTAGTVAPGQTGINFVGPGGETRTMPCGSPIPAGWTCTCNCVSVCSCDGHCSCNVQGGHYWYPN